MGKLIDAEEVVKRLKALDTDNYDDCSEIFIAEHMKEKAIAIIRETPSEVK